MYEFSPKVKKIFEDRLLDEMTASYAYNYLSMCCVSSGYFPTAKWFLDESQDEMSHAQKLIDYMLGRSEEADLPNLKQPKLEFTNILSGLNIAEKMEVDLAKKYSTSIKEAFEEEDIDAFNFLMQFIEIQREAIKTLKEKILIFKPLKDEEDEREAEQWAFGMPTPNEEIKG